MEFNLAQRNAKNYLEQITILTFVLFILAWIWPVATIVFGLINFFARIGLVILYSKSPQARVYFAPIVNLNLVASMFTAMAATIYW